MHTFVNHNGITPDGKAVITALEAQLKAAGKDPNRLNQLPGYARHYAANVQLLGTMTQEQWLQDFSGAAEIVMESVQANAQAQAQTEATVNTSIEKKLATFEKKLLASVKKLITEAETAGSADAETETEADAGAEADAEEEEAPEEETDDDGDDDA